MSALIAAAVIVPLIGAALAVLFAGARTAQRVVALVAVSITGACSVGILAGVTSGEVSVLRVGGWDANSAGVVLVADLTGALFLTVSMASVLGVLLFAMGQAAPGVDAPAFYPVYLVLTAGVSLVFLTGDLFTLFVAFELLLIASYVLLTLGRRGDQVRGAMTYVVINLIAGALFLATVALIYASVGSVNLAVIAERLDQLGSSTVLAIGLLLLVVFGIKAAIVPLYFWLPDSYPAAPTAITAVFAGLLTKIGVYALIRTMTLFELDRLGTLLLVVASVTMLLGVLGAIAQDDMKRILSFHIISQIGYMVLGLGLFSVAGVTAAIFFTLHQIPVKTALFLTGGLVEERAGTSALRRVDGLAHTAPAIAVLFALAAASLAGLPPMSGFIGKLGLLEAGVERSVLLPVVISLAASLLTLVSMTKIWTQVFWGKANGQQRSVAEGKPAAMAPAGSRGLMTGATASVVGVTLAIAVFAQPIWTWSETAAQSLLDPEPYVAIVGGSASDGS